jgi:hypothetical protein
MVSSPARSNTPNIAKKFAAVRGFDLRSAHPFPRSKTSVTYLTAGKPVKEMPGDV